MALRDLHKHPTIRRRDTIKKESDSIPLEEKIKEIAKSVISSGEVVVQVPVSSGGYIPVKGVDYFDGEDGYTPVKDIDYFDGEDGHTPQKNVDYFDGITPIKGIDYFDGIDGQSFEYSDFTPEQLLALKGDKGDKGDDGGFPIPEDTTINRNYEGEIISIVKPSKTINITREGGQITSIEDGTYQKDIIRTNGIITSVDITTL
jgi:hypothetical protein